MGFSPKAGLSYQTIVSAAFGKKNKTPCAFQSVSELSELEERLKKFNERLQRRYPALVSERGVDEGAREDRALLPLLKRTLFLFSPSRKNFRRSCSRFPKRSWIWKKRGFTGTEGLLW